MNYAKSKDTITPIINDTPPLLSNLISLLHDRTSYDIPFCLMPVRTETRFMFVTRNLFDATYSNNVSNAVQGFVSLNNSITGQGLFQGFTSATTVSASLEIQQQLSSVAALVALIPDLNPAERFELKYQLQKSTDTFANTSRNLLTFCTENGLVQQLNQNISSINNALQQLNSSIDQVADNTEWQSQVSDMVVSNWNTYGAPVLSNNDQLFQNIFQSGSIQQSVFDNYVSSTSHLLDFFKNTSTDSYIDRLYIWQQLSHLESQFSSIYGYIENEHGNNNQLLSLLQITGTLSETWYQILFPGIAEQRLTPVADADNAQLFSHLDPHLSSLGTSINQSVLQNGTIINSLINNDGSWNDTLFNQYLTTINTISNSLNGVQLPDEKSKKFIWLQLAPLNKQFTQIKSIVNSAKQGDPTAAAALLASFNTATFTLAYTWQNALSVSYQVVQWYNPVVQVHELWIRVYPDDIFINSLESELSQNEISAGIFYWNSWWQAHGDEQLQLAAWQNLVALYGTERAAWIVYLLTPTNFSNVVIINPVFSVLNQINLLNTYTLQLNSVVNSTSSLDLSHINFYTNQVSFLSTNIAKITSLPASYKNTLVLSAQEANNNFSQLGTIILAKTENREDFASSISSVSAQFSTLNNSVQNIEVISSWDQLYSQAPVFPQLTAKDGSWTQPSYTDVLPDRFLFAAIDDYEATTTSPYDDPVYGSYFFNHIKIGNRIPLKLYTGIDPQNSSFSVVQSNGHLQIDPNINWIVDFDDAVSKGVATAIRLTDDEATKGFDKIVVMGLKLAEGEATTFSPDYGKTKLENLLNNHHYSSGLSLLQLGTPTNNTDNSNSGYNQSDPNSLLSFQTEVQNPLFNITSSIIGKKDGQWLADALGIEYSVFQHICNADKTQISDAIAMNRALFNGTIGNYMKEMLNFLFTEDNVNRTRAYFTDYVLGRGTLPSIRTGKQPYGILPVTSFGRWEWKREFNKDLPPEIRVYSDINNNQTGLIGDYYFDNYKKAFSISPYQPQDFDNFLQDRFYNRLSQAFEILHRTWLDMGYNYSPTVDQGGSLAAPDLFMNLLGRDATMAEAYNRFFLNNEWYDYIPSQSSSYIGGLDYLGLPHTSLTSNPSEDGLPLLYNNLLSQPTGAIELPRIFFELFNSFSFPVPSNSTGTWNPLGDDKGLFDLTSFLSYEKAANKYAPFSGSSFIPYPDMKKIRNALRIFNVTFMDDLFTLYGPTVDEKNLSETSQLTSYLNQNYIQWLRSASLTNIWNNNVFGTMQSRSLLFLLMRQSTLLTYRETAWDLLEKTQMFTRSARKIIGTPEAVVFQHSQGFLNSPGINKWQPLFRSLNDLNTDAQLSPVFQFFRAYCAAFDFKNSVPDGGMTPPNTIYMYDPGNGNPPPLSSITNPPQIAPLPSSWQSTVLANYLKTSGNISDIENNLDRTAINQLNEALDHLATCTNAELDRLLREHIDLCTYRLDAWSAGMVNKRLWEKRNTDAGANPSGRQKGIYLGAYSWLLNVRPKLGGTNLTLVDPQNLPQNLTEFSKVYYDSTNLGFIHAPSISHALTAAILRSGYKSENNGTTNDMFAVNLSSERVKTALTLIEGVRNGQTLGALLGYEFERNLHERYPGVELDVYVYELRKYFSLSDPKTIQNNIQATNANTVTNPNATTVAENVRPLNVVDGVELLGYFRDKLKYIIEIHPRSSLYDIYNNNLADTVHNFTYYYTNTILADLSFLPSLSLMVPGTSTPVFSLIITEIDRIANAIDALGDLSLAEGIFQAAKGNYELAAATVESLSEGNNPQSPQIIETPVNTIHIAHKLLAFVKAYDTTSQTLSSPWANISISVRAETEPNLNNWIAELLFASYSSSTSVTISSFAANVGCNVAYMDGTTQSSVTIYLSDLNLQPIDLLYLVQSGVYKDELTQRIIYFVRKNEQFNNSTGIPYNIPLSIDLTNKGNASLASFENLLTLLNSISSIINGSRWLTAKDLVYSSAVTTNSTVSSQFNLAELSYRYTTLLGNLTTVMQYFNGLATPIPSSIDLTTLRDNLMKASYFGINYGIPDSAIEIFTDQVVSDMLNIIVPKVKSDLNSRNTNATNIVSNINNLTSETDKIQAYLGAIACILGNEFKVLPHFNFNYYPNLKSDITTQLTATGNNDIMRNSADIVGDLDDWLYGIARVREKVDDIETVRLFTYDANSHPLQSFRPVQFPYTPYSASPVVQADYWLGLEYPSTYTPGDKTSQVIFNYGELTNTTSYANYCGFIVDQWSESIPLDSQSTGITFNYDTPSAKPPQNILLAINPQAIQAESLFSGEPQVKQWRLEDLLHTLLDTMDMAKIRMVEPDHFTSQGSTDNNDRKQRFEVFKCLLPAVVGECMDVPNNVSFDYNNNNIKLTSIPGSVTNNNTISVVDWNAVTSSQVLSDTNLQAFINEQQILSSVAATQNQLNLITQLQTP